MLLFSLIQITPIILKEKQNSKAKLKNTESVTMTQGEFQLLVVPKLLSSKCCLNGMLKSHKMTKAT